MSDTLTFPERWHERMREHTEKRKASILEGQQKHQAAATGRRA